MVFILMSILSVLVSGFMQMPAYAQEGDTPAELPTIEFTGDGFVKEVSGDQSETYSKGLSVFRLSPSKDFLLMGPKSTIDNSRIRWIANSDALIAIGSNWTNVEFIPRGGVRDPSNVDWSALMEKGRRLSINRLTNIDWRGANLSGSVFGLSRLAEINLAGTKLDGVDFSGSRLLQVDLRGADISMAISFFGHDREQYTEVKYNDQTIFPEGFIPEGKDRDKFLREKGFVKVPKEQDVYALFKADELHQVIREVAALRNPKLVDTFFEQLHADRGSVQKELLTGKTIVEIAQAKLASMQNVAKFKKDKESGCIPAEMLPPDLNNSLEKLGLYEPKDCVVRLEKESISGPGEREDRDPSSPAGATPYGSFVRGLEAI